MVPVCGGAGGRLLRMAGAGRRPLLLSLSRGRCSSAGGNPAAHGRALALKKRGYDITRNPHLNKFKTSSRTVYKLQMPTPVNLRKGGAEE